MSSHLTRIEVYENEEGTFYFSCCDMDLMGYSNINNLLEDIKKEFEKELGGSHG